VLPAPNSAGTLRIQETGLAPYSYAWSEPLKSFKGLAIFFGVYHGKNVERFQLVRLWGKVSAVKTTDYTSHSVSKTNQRNNKMTNTTDFTTREQYVAWRAAWRIEYNNLSIAIRTLKTAIADLMKNGEYSGVQQARLAQLRANANQMLETRLASKIQAGLIRNTGEATPAQIAAGIALAKEGYETARILAMAKEKIRIEKKKAGVMLKNTRLPEMLAAD
jgi:hypothetical protein